MDEPLEKLVGDVLSSPKYAHIDPGLVARIGQGELGKGRKYKEVVKATKNKLHQVGGAYFTAALHYESWLAELKLAEDLEDLKQICWMLMGKHASTRERLPILKDFYAEIFSYLPAVHSILDIACGMNPLSIPWMPLSPGTTYQACDMYADMVQFVDEFIKLLPLDGQAQVCDVVSAPPDTPVDLALVLKAIPCLEQIDQQAGTRLLDGIKARYLVLSFPAKSLGGRRKGMVENYQARFEELAEGRSWKVLARLEYETELAFVVKS